MIKAQVVTEVWIKVVNKDFHNFTPYQILSERECIFTFVFVAVMGVEPTLGIGL
jgi:hypothetical protein